MNGLNGLLKWCGEVIAFASAPLWNHPDRMGRVSQFLLRSFTAVSYTHLTLPTKA